MDRNTTFTNATNSSNATEFAPMPQFSVRWYQVDIVYVVFSGILAFMIVLGNSLVIGAFHVNRRLRTTSNMLLMSLATADMMIGTISVPMWVYDSVPHVYHLGDIYEVLDIICGVSSVLNLTVISLERCYALIYPIKHRSISKRMPLYIFNQFLSWVDVNTLINFLRDFRHNFFKNFTFFFLLVEGLLPTLSFLNSHCNPQKTMTSLTNAIAKISNCLHQFWKFLYQ